MPRAVVDTNVFVSGAVNPHGSPGRVIDAWLEGKFDLVISDRQRAEITEVFSRPSIARYFRITLPVLAELFRRIAAITPVVTTSSIPVQVRDAKDLHILAAAIDGNADYLVTGDEDLLLYREDPRLAGLQIVTAVQFLVVIDV